jgi:hypothetical protein
MRSSREGEFLAHAVIGRALAEVGYAFLEQVADRLVLAGIDLGRHAGGIVFEPDRSIRCFLLDRAFGVCLAGAMINAPSGCACRAGAVARSAYASRKVDAGERRHGGKNPDLP